jgi:hypothetical protein
MITKQFICECDPDCKLTINTALDSNELDTVVVATLKNNIVHGDVVLSRDDLKEFIAELVKFL